MAQPKLGVEDIKGMKGRQIPIPCLTAYDYPMTRLLDEAGVPLILIGDSLGMVVLGHPDTTHVTMSDMLHHVAAAARARPKALLVADLPYGSYDDEREAVRNARRLMDAGAEAVKAEGGRAILPQIQSILQEGIPILGHLGMLPQHILEEGRYRIKGRLPEEHEALLADARALEEAGAFGLVLELVTPPVAAEITRSLRIPTVGIGSGRECDGQILVTHDLVGMFPWFTPRFVEPELEAGRLMKEAVTRWMEKVGPPHQPSA